jgi:cytochrome b561
MMRNTKAGYGAVAIALHWIVAAAFIVNYALVYYSDWFLEPRSDLGRTLTSTHAAIGVSVLVFVGLRILWRLTNQQPDDVPGTRLEHMASHVVHLVLYGIMIGMPLTGYLGYGGSSNLFFAIELPSFQNTWLFTNVISGGLGLTWDSFEGVMDYLHKSVGAYAVLAIVALHVGAALFHHFIRRDEVMVRMINSKISTRE